MIERLIEIWLNVETYRSITKPVYIGRVSVYVKSFRGPRSNLIVSAKLTPTSTSGRRRGRPAPGPCQRPARLQSVKRSPRRPTRFQISIVHGFHPWDDRRSRVEFRPCRRLEPVKRTGRQAAMSPTTARRKRQLNDDVIRTSGNPTDRK